MIRNRIPLVKKAVLGAGLTGLSVAYHGGGVIFEKEKVIGGTCRSLKKQGFSFDLGIHVLHSRNDYVLNLLRKDQTKLKLAKRSAWIYSHGVLTKYPFQVNTYGLPENIVKECIAGFRESVRIKRTNFNNYKEWIYANFGKGISEHFYIPYSEKFWCVKTENLTVDWVDIRIPRPRLDQVIRGATSLQDEEFGPNAEFKYPRKGGIQGIAESLTKTDSRIILGKEAVRIDLEKSIIYFKDKTAVHYQNLISTIPLPELYKIIGTVPKKIGQAFKNLKYNSVLCVNLGIKRQNLSSAHWIYFPEKQYSFFRISFPGNFSNSLVPKDWSSIQAEISYSEFNPVVNKDITGRVIKDLLKARIIGAKDKVRLINKTDIKYAYVIYDHDRQRNVKLIRDYLKLHNVYAAGRYGKWEYLWMDQAILSGKEAAEGAESP